jgi:transcriptional regulator with XRE-family HTH domain
MRPAFERRGKSLARIHEETGIDYHNLHKLLKGSHAPSWASAVLLAKALGCSLDDFLPGDN